MAIIIEQEKKPINWIGILTGAIIVVALFGGAYYLFFKNPQILETATTGGKLGSVKNITEIKFDPEPIIQRMQTDFNVQLDATIPEATPGRQNPFSRF